MRNISPHKATRIVDPALYISQNHVRHILGTRQPSEIPIVCIPSTSFFELTVRVLNLPPYLSPCHSSIFAGNRDEYLRRPTSRAHFWPAPHDSVLAGTDLQHHNSGTWLGITTSGRFAALTNFRESIADLPPDLESRGYLVRDFLVADAGVGPREYLEDLEKRKDRFGGFSLLCVDLAKDDGEGRMEYYSNRQNTTVVDLKAEAVHGLSNSVLEAPWPKVQNGREAMRSILAETSDDEDQLIEKLFIMLGAYTPFTDTTSIKQVYEEMKSAIRITNIPLTPNEPYGTRTSTVVLVDREGTVTFLERDWFDTITFRELGEEERRTVGEVGWRFRIGEEAKLAERVVRIVEEKKG